MWAKIGDDQIWESRTTKPLGVTIDNELKFDEYISNVCKKGPKETYCTDKNKKVPRFQKIATFIENIFDSQFKYYPLTWMCHNRTTNNKINKLHERALRLLFISI